ATQLPQDFIVRAPMMADLEAFFNLIIACDIADIGEADTTMDDLLSQWQDPHFNLAADARAIVTSQGQIIGYTDVRQGRMGMEIEMDEAPPAPVWPDGITIRPFVPGEDNRVVHYVIQEAFSELAGRVYQPFEEWEQWALKRSDFDPTLLYLVMVGGEVVGTVL